MKTDVLKRQIDANAAAALIKCSPRWVRELVKLGFIPRPARGCYVIGDVVHGRIDSLQDEAKRASRTASESRVRDARAREIELRTAREEAKLIETDEAIASINEVLAILKSEAAGLPARVTRDDQLREKIATEVDDIFRRASDRWEKLARELRAPEK